MKSSSNRTADWTTKFMSETSQLLYSYLAKLLLGLYKKKLYTNTSAAFS